MVDELLERQVSIAMHPGEWLHMRLDFGTVQYGIPQGSLLGPRLYTIYVNDLPDAITLGNVLMYADDTTIYCIGKSFDEVCLKLNKVFDELRLWSLRSKLSIHPIKTEAMILTKQGFIGPAPPPPPPPSIVRRQVCQRCGSYYLFRTDY